MKTKPSLDSSIKHFQNVDFVCAAFGAADGYGKSAEQLALGLERKGTTIQIAGPCRPIGQITATSIWNRRFAPFGEAVVYYGLPTTWHRQDHRRSLGFTMYESDGLPAAWYPSLSNVDEVIVPSPWLVPIFEDVTTRPVKVVPLGVDVSLFEPKLRKRGKELRFLHFCTTGGEFRKGADLAIAAFIAAFPTEQDVSLTIRSTSPWNNPPRTDRRINFSGGNPMSNEALTRYYHNFDALLYPSRGEGFGMIPLEAMASGMPAIFADSTGMADFAEFGLTVPSRRVVSAMGERRPYLVARDGTFGHWQEPYLDAIVERLRAVASNYDMIAQQSFENTKKIAAQWSWDKSANALYRRIGS